MKTHRLFPAIIPFLIASPCLAADPVDIGSRRELSVDDFMVDTMKNVSLELHQPVRMRFILKEADVYSWKFE